MPNKGTIANIVAASVGGFALLLLIISVGTTTWLDDGNGDTVGLFRKCFGNNASVALTGYEPGCYSENRVTQGGLSVFGLLLLAFGVITIILYIFLQREILLVVSLILFYFSSMFVMSAYATWGVYSRDPYSYFFPYNLTSTQYTSSGGSYTSLGASYNLCVAAHYFLWTALTALAFGVGYTYGQGPNTQG
jgi:hypothetical protein